MLFNGIVIILVLFKWNCNFKSTVENGIVILTVLFMNGIVLNYGIGNLKCCKCGIANY